MDADTFTALALRVISREATEEEQRALKTELLDPARNEEFQQLQITHDVLRVAAPMTEATLATGPELPAYRRNELRTAVRQHFGPVAAKSRGSLFPALRWIFAGGGATVLGVIVVLFVFANRTVEVGLYQTDLVRGETSALAASHVAADSVVTFDRDAPFDQWQKQPLSWYQRAKIWTDNEHDLLHVVSRDAHGDVIESTQPLATTPDAQRAQISSVVESLRAK